MGPTAFRDGIFSQSDPMSRYGQLLQSYSDGSLGATGPTAFRDGVFSQSDPMSRYGQLLQSYSDGSLGADVTPPAPPPLTIRAACYRVCLSTPKTRRQRVNCVRTCRGLPPLPIRQKKRTVSGLGQMETSTKVALGVGAVLVGALVVMPMIGGAKSKKRQR